MTSIPPDLPLLQAGQGITRAYTDRLAVAIQSDGCTDVPQFHHGCCVVHDLAYRYGIDPWGRITTRSDADRRFRQCMQAESPLGRFDPMSWWRWAAVRLFGRLFYQRHS